MMENDKNKNTPLFNTEEQKKLTSLENLIKVRKNLSEDIDRYNPHPDKTNDEDEENDNDGLKEYRGIF